MTDPTPIDSILTSTKKLLGVGAADTSFDLDIILGINSAFAYLQQLGVGPLTGYKITDASNLWTEFTGTEEAPNSLALESVKMFIFYTTKLGFDPPPNSFGQQAMKDQADKLAWLLDVQQEGIRHPYVTTG